MATGKSRIDRGDDTSADHVRTRRPVPQASRSSDDAQSNAAPMDATVVSALDRPDLLDGTHDRL